MRPPVVAVLLLFALALGVGAWFTQGSEPGARALGLGLLGVLLGAGMLALCWDALDAGRLRLRTTSIEQATRPVLFWFTLGLYAACGLTLLATGLRYLLVGAPLDG